MAANDLTIERLRDALHYDQDTGAFTWVNPNRKGNAKKGARAGSVQNTGHRVITVDGASHCENRLAWFYMTGNWPADLVDHVDGNPANNAWQNLRAATRQQNSWNTASRRGVFKGVYRKRNSTQPLVKQCRGSPRSLFLADYFWRTFAIDWHQTAAA